MESGRSTTDSGIHSSYLGSTTVRFDWVVILKEQSLISETVGSKYEGLFCISINFDQAIALQIMKEQETGFIAAFRFDQIVHIVFDEKQFTGCAAFNLKLLKAHRQISAPDGFGTDMVRAFFAVENIIPLRRAFDILFYGNCGIIRHIEWFIGCFFICSQYAIC